MQLTAAARRVTQPSTFTDHISQQAAVEKPAAKEPPPSIYRAAAVLKTNHVKWKNSTPTKHTKSGTYAKQTQNTDSKLTNT